MSRSVFGWAYPPGCSGAPEDRTAWRTCKCGKSEEDHEIDENDNLGGCTESGYVEFEEAEQADEPLVDYDLLAKDDHDAEE